MDIVYYRVGLKKWTFSKAAFLRLAGTKCRKNNFCLEY